MYQGCSVRAEPFDELRTGLSKHINQVLPEPAKTTETLRQAPRAHFMPFRSTWKTRMRGIKLDATARTYKFTFSWQWIGQLSLTILWHPVTTVAFDATPG
jgi:hypothetical protein